jgi:hypothetical protein
MLYGKMIYLQNPTVKNLLIIYIFYVKIMKHKLLQNEISDTGARHD